MRAIVISTSRADWNGLGMVAKALRDQGADVTVVPWGDGCGDRIQADGFDLPDGFRWNPLPHPFISDIDLMAVLWGQVRPDKAATMPEEARSFDMAVVLGDRHETLLAAFSCALMGVPVAHIGGGDVSAGSLDELWRHAITKIASIHFPCSRESEVRILQMGEDPSRVFCFGSPSIDRVRTMERVPAEEFQSWISGYLKTSTDFVLANWQPVFGPHRPAAALEELLDALGALDNPVFFVGPNDDPGAEEVRSLIKEWCDERPGFRAFVQHVEPKLYAAMMQRCAFMIGNSSSAYYEAPAYGTYAIDVGIRQAGRSPAYPHRVAGNTSAILQAIRDIEVWPKSGKAVLDLLGSAGNASTKIAAKIVEMTDSRPANQLLNKRYWDGVR